ncbi:hypothetical protein HOH30_00110 [Candidatus Woesearchaeota archaeon]|jgi:hypothetical protein|nr:hypothetical protein [Candidatus Woesearchaeota archaeon]
MKTFKNKLTNQTRTAPTGFSFTTFFFMPIPQLLKGDFKTFLVMLVIAISLFVIPVLGVIGFIVMWLYYSFTYNDTYVISLMNDGFTEVQDDYSNRKAKRE